MCLSSEVLTEVLCVLYKINSVLKGLNGHKMGCSPKKYKLWGSLACSSRLKETDINYDVRTFFL
jgi:hypothetical protein